MATSIRLAMAALREQRDWRLSPSAPVTFAWPELRRLEWELLLAALRVYYESCKDPSSELMLYVVDLLDDGYELPSDVRVDDEGRLLMGLPPNRRWQCYAQIETWGERQLLPVRRRRFIACKGVRKARKRRARKPERSEVRRIPPAPWA
jgi:hypothetical protein